MPRFYFVVTCRTIGIFLSLLLGMFTNAYAADPNEFEVINYDLGNNGVNMYGRLFVPDNYDSAQSYPLVISLHGLGEYGTDNADQVNGNIDNLLAAAKSHDFFLYAPQSATQGWDLEKMDAIMRMAGQISQAYSVDLDRVYTTGLSNGGAGAYTMLSNYTQAFAAGVAICGNTGSATDNSKLIQVPLWIFHAIDDHTENNVTYSRDRVNGMRAEQGKTALSWRLNDDPSNPYYNNGEPYYSASSGHTFYDEDGLRYTEYSEGGHGIWGRAYGESHLYDWLLEQSRSLNSLEAGESMRFDFGNSAYSEPDSEGHYWNSSRTWLERTLDAMVFPFCKTETGERTRVMVEVAQTFAGWHIASTTGTLPFEDNIALDGWSTLNGQTNADPTSTIAFHGLNPNQSYRVQIFATSSSDDGGRTRTTRYEIHGASVDLDPYLNESTFAEFTEVTADANGSITLNVLPSPDTNARFGLISAAVITALSNELTANDDNASTDESTAVFVDVLANDFPANMLSIAANTAPAHGIASIVGDQIEYTPDYGYIGMDSFSYTMTDGVDTASATVTVQVNSIAVADDLTDAGLTGGEIGANASGSSRVIPDDIWEVTSSGEGLIGTEDSFYFEQLAIEGDFQALVRVQALSVSPASLRAGLMVRESLDADSRNAWLGSAPSGYVYSGGRATVGASSSETVGSMQYLFPDLWLLLQREGDVITLASSAQDNAYTEIDSVTLPSLSSSVYLGIFGTSGDDSIATLAQFSDFQIIEINEGEGIASVGHWRLDETSGVTAEDSSGESDATLYGDAAWDTGGRFDGCLYLDGSNDWVEIPHNDLHSGSELSISMWFNPDVLDGSPRALISKRWGVNIDRTFSIFMNQSNNRLFIDIGTERFDTGYAITQTGVWQHLAMVFDGSLGTDSLKLYLDGVLIYTAQPSAAEIANNDIPIYAGIFNADYGTSFSGYIDDIRIYDLVLDVDGVALLAQGLEPDNQDVVEEGLVSFWSLDQSSGVVAIDETGFQDADLQGDAAWATSGYSGQALYLDGQNDWLEVPDLAEYEGSQLTLAMWFQPQLLDGQPRGLISKRTSPQSRAFSIFTNSWNNRIYIDIGSERFDTGYSISELSVWHHIAVVFDGSLSQDSLKLYIDGVQVYATQPVAQVIPDIGAPLTFGILNADYGTGFCGLIDEVRTYDRPLDALEILSLAD
ncbi:LamG-like jellyroll fold domain-containing protein [Cerasicoccus maritimus]|uniref:LamG-like jellyroll fold domain-containing protein n=1 Tax=Cerasicoccus maritimus TaxID=490089 RepID=UPI0028524E33|nr:LamG-like jellyroll fold domain-containing protein [Cerasicoccus maritimus]